MRRALAASATLLTLVFGLLGWMPGAYAQGSSAAEAITGYLATSGCPGTRAPPCFLQWSPTNPLPTIATGGSAIIGKVGIDQTTPGTTNGVQITATTAVAPIVSAAAESNHVLKAAAGSLLTVSTTVGASAGYMLIFDATSAPGDGAVTPKYCIPVAANNFAAATWPVPATFATGITVVFSTTGCFTKAASATAFFVGQVQ